MILTPPFSNNNNSLERIKKLTRLNTAPIRLTISLASTLYTFLASASSPLYSPSGARLSRPVPHAQNTLYNPSTWGGDALKNRVFFAFAFVETFSWFWVWVTLREERSAFEARRARRMHMD